MVGADGEDEYPLNRYPDQVRLIMDDEVVLQGPGPWQEVLPIWAITELASLRDVWPIDDVHYPVGVIQVAAHVLVPAREWEGVELAEIILCRVIIADHAGTPRVYVLDHPDPR